MSEYETEEQQVEALKKWWKENSASIIVGLLVGVSALFGWRYYGDQQNAHALQASNLYMQITQSIALNNVDDKTIDISNQLVNEYSSTPYAALASLALAKTEYEKDNVEGAVAQLELAIKLANEDTIKQIANLRLVSIYIEQKKYDEAASLLNIVHSDVYDAQYEEVRGDLHAAKGEAAQARVAYDKAIDLLGAEASKWLILKRQNLGSV